MWRTGVTLLLVSLAVNAIQNADHIQFVNENAIMGKGPVRVVKNSDTLVADVPIEQKPKPEEPKQEDESTLSRAFRVIRSNAVPHALKLAGLGQGNQLADAQPTHTITTSGNTFDMTFGKSTPATTITVEVSLENDVLFVYGKSKCEAIKCRNATVTNTFDESRGTLDTTAPTTFNFTPPFQNGWASGSNYKNQVALKDFTVDEHVFGVADAGNPAEDVIPSPADGYIGFGFTAASGPKYNTITKLLNLVAPSRSLTIWRDSDLKAGVLHFGDTTYEKCSKTLTTLVNTVPDNNNINQWWFSADTVEVDGISLKTQVVKVNINSGADFRFPETQYNKIKAKLTNGFVDDPKKLPTIKITIAKDVIELDGSIYTVKLQDKMYMPLLGSTGKSDQFNLQLGGAILKKLCVILKQTDDKGTALQMGFAYGNFSPSSMSVSVFGLIMLPLVYLMGL